MRDAIEVKPAPFQFSPPGRGLFHYRVRANELQDAHGEPHYAPDGPRRLPAWGFEYLDGLILELQLNEADGLCYVHGPLRETRMAIGLLGVEDRIAWRMDQDWPTFERALEAYHPADWGRWTVRGGPDEPVLCLSPREAHWRLERLVAAGHDGRIDELPIDEARARRARILATGPSQRRLPGERGRTDRFEVWKVGPDEAASLLALFSNEAQAQAYLQTHRAKPHSAEVTYELRTRRR